MRKYRITFMHLTALAVLTSALTVIIAGPTTTPHPKQHTTNGDFWANVRMKPVTITSVEDHTLHWKFEDTHSIELGSFVTDQYTEGDVQEGKTYLVIYCELHKTAYRIVPVK